MKPSQERGPQEEADESSPPLATTNSFNIDDNLANEEAPQQPNGGQSEADTLAARQRRSPSPSAISTASSGSPLIRSDSSTSAASLNGGPSHQRKQHSSSNQQQQQSGPLKRPAPTSIAAAQLQQQGLHGSQNSENSARSQKHPNGNKLAHMAKLQARSHLEQPAVDYRLKASLPANERSSSSAGQQQQQQRDKPKRKSAQIGAGEENGKSFGYNLGKTLAFRANRFNEFWSVNKMRYMNLACLLMTLVCLCTILLFSKTSLTTTTTTKSSSPGPASPDAGPSQQLGGSASLAERLRHRHRILEANSDQDRREDDSEQEAPVESIDSMDRQAFVRAPGQRHSLTNNDEERDESANHEDSATSASGSRTGANSDGFNLFDDRHDDSTESSSSSKRSLDDMLQDAQRQLRRQQENELELEQQESANQNKSLQESLSDSTKPTKPLMDPISQVLQDLDGFGLFKSIKTRLIDQLQQQNLTSKAPTIVRSKNGATIIMSFSGNDAASPSGNSSSASNGTSSPAEPPLPSFLRDLLPPMLSSGSGPGSSSLLDRRPSGFAAITINSEPILSIRSSGLPFGGFESSFGGPFMGPSSPFGLPMAPMITPSRGPLFMTSGGGGGGLMSMIMRASSELANQMRQQLEQQAADNQTQAAANGTGIKPEASQQVKVIQLFGDELAGRPKNDSKSTAGSDAQNATTTANTPTSKGDEDPLDTFGFGRLFAAPAATTRQTATFRLPLSPFHSIYSTSRRSIPLGGGSMVMLESSSGGLPSIMGGESSSNPFGPPPTPPAAFLNELGLRMAPRPFPILPNMFLFGGQPNQPQRASPLVSSILNHVMSDLHHQKTLDEASSVATNLKDQPAEGKPTIVGPNGRAWRTKDDNQDDDKEWDEFVPPTGNNNNNNKSGPRARAVDQTDLLSDSSDEPAGSQEGPFRLGPVASSSSVFEQMFEQLNRLEGGPQQTFGTIRQTYRGPNGVTVERVIGLPQPQSQASKVQEHEGSVQIVPTGVRSQSLSRMDTPTDGNNNHNKLHLNPFERLFGGELEPHESAAASGPGPKLASPSNFISQLLGHELASDRQDEGHEPMPPIRGFRAHIGPFRASLRRQALIERSDNQDSDQDDESPMFGPVLPRVRVASARIRLVSPHRSESSGPAPPPSPMHLHMLANAALANGAGGSPSDETVAERRMSSEGPHQQQHQNKRLPASSPFTSPSSPLFGFPIMKKAPLEAAAVAAPSGSHQQEPVSVGSGGDPERERASNEPPAPPASVTVSHRRQRSFVYHSNHEVAQNHARPRAPAPSKQQQQQQPLVITVARAANGEGQPMAESRSAGPPSLNQQQPQLRHQQAPPLPPAASIVMGRRLDDFIERRR